MKPRMKPIISAAEVVFAAAAALLLLVVSMARGSDLYPPMSDRSWAGVQSWSMPRIATGTSLPPVASGTRGDLFINVASEGQPLLYRLGNLDGVASWALVAGGGSSGGSAASSGSTLGTYVVTITNPVGDQVLMFDGMGGIQNQYVDHAGLLNLDYENSGHTGFAPTTHTHYGFGQLFDQGTMLTETRVYTATQSENFEPVAIGFYAGGSTGQANLAFQVAPCGALLFPVRTSYSDESNDPLVMPKTGLVDGVMEVINSRPCFSFDGAWRETLFTRDASASIDILTASETYTNALDAVSITADTVEATTIQGEHLASDSTPGITTTVSIPYQWGVSTMTMTIKDGLITNVSAPQ